MADLQKALAEINVIRGQMARTAEFRGYGPATLAAIAALASAAALIQAHWLRTPERDLVAFLAIWIATAAVTAAGAIWIIWQCLNRRYLMRPPP